MQKPLFKNLENDIDALLNHFNKDHFTRDTLRVQIINVLHETYDALNKLNECRIENDHIGKFENDRTSVQKYIDCYQALYEQAKEQEDNSLIFRYGYTTHIYETFLKQPEKALTELRIPIAQTALYEYSQHRMQYEQFMSQVDPKTLFYSQRNYEHRDLFLNLYRRLEGYQVTHEKIIKSAGLKIFNFFNVITKIQKTKLAKLVEHLFARLGENTLTLDPKRASSIKVTGEFKGFVLFDYMNNKKGRLYDFGLQEAFNQALDSVSAIYKVQKNVAMVRRIRNNRDAMEAALLAKLLT